MRDNEEFLKNNLFTPKYGKKQVQYYQYYLDIIRTYKGLTNIQFKLSSFKELIDNLEKRIKEKQQPKKKMTKKEKSKTT